MAIPIRVETLTYEHVATAIDILADHSREEITAAGGLCAAKMWGAIARNEPAFTGFIDDELACIFGVTSGTILGDSATLWMLVTRHATAHPLLFVRHSRGVLQLIRARYSLVKCFVNVDYKARTKWMNLLGFDACAIVQSPSGDFCEYRLR